MPRGPDALVGHEPEADLVDDVRHAVDDLAILPGPRAGHQEADRIDRSADQHEQPHRLERVGEQRRSLPEGVSQRPEQDADDHQLEQSGDDEKSAPPPGIDLGNRAVTIIATTSCQKNVVPSSTIRSRSRNYINSRGVVNSQSTYLSAVGKPWPDRYTPVILKEGNRQWHRPGPPRPSCCGIPEPLRCGAGRNRVGRRPWRHIPSTGGDSRSAGSCFGTRSRAGRHVVMCRDFRGRHAVVPGPRRRGPPTSSRHRAGG